ncbi:MAG TPA: metalloregulator ArsR/SmtB family transcription factor [Solirubrobacterales bacterium]|nr:metalloregulator ArsR/SmtB family transcription factor [Solirubrobacterales bacterium]
MQQTFEALVEPRRRDILALIRNTELPAGHIAEAFPDVSRPAVSQHLRVLREAGLISERRDGTKRLYRFDPAGFADLRSFLDSFWDERLELLKTAAEQEERTSHARNN